MGTIILGFFCFLLQAVLFMFRELFGKRKSGPLPWYGWLDAMK